MLSYRHSFHAGNYADVLKHALLSRVLLYMTQKQKPLFYLDTHAGRGLYDLTSFEANKTGEYGRGVALVDAADCPEELQPYMECVQAVNSGSKLKAYPGSPWIAQQLLRPSDRMNLCELHPQDFRLLEDYFGGSSQVKCYYEDGLAKALGLLPPHEKRAVVMIDPSYEVKAEYQGVVDFLRAAHAKFALGVYILWYPIVDAARIERMKKQLIATGIRRISMYELHLSDDHQEVGMTGTGLLVINPPWTLLPEMRVILNYLSERFAAKGPWLAEELVGE